MEKSTKQKPIKKEAPKQTQKVSEQSKPIKKDKKEKFQQLKEKNKQRASLFNDRVKDKSDLEAVAAFLNQEIVRHLAYSKVKKGVDDRMMKAFDKFEAY